MKYSKPTIRTIGACAAIQSGNNKPSTLAVEASVLRIDTPQAYEADE